MFTFLCCWLATARVSGSPQRPASLLHRNKGARCGCRGRFPQTPHLLPLWWANRHACSKSGLQPSRSRNQLSAKTQSQAFCLVFPSFQMGQSFLRLFLPCFAGYRLEAGTTTRASFSLKKARAWLFRFFFRFFRFFRSPVVFWWFCHVPIIRQMPPPEGLNKNRVGALIASMNGGV